MGHHHSNCAKHGEEKHRTGAHKAPFMPHPDQKHRQTRSESDASPVQTICAGSRCLPSRAGPDQECPAVTAVAEARADGVLLCGELLGMVLPHPVQAPSYAVARHVRRLTPVPWLHAA